MLAGKGGVKWFHPQIRRVLVEALRIHERHRAEPANVAIVQHATVGENELHVRVPELLCREIATVDQQSAGESWLHHDPVARGELEDDELGAPPAARDRRSGYPRYQVFRIDLAQDVRS